MGRYPVVSYAQIVLRKEDFEELKNSRNPIIYRTIASLMVISHTRGREIKWNNQEQQTVMIGPEHLIQRLEDYLHDRV